MYLHNFSNKEDVAESFGLIGSLVLTDYNIILASYGTDNYSGEAFVLFFKDGKLWEVNGSHCSCDGLEGQWKPEETNFEALEHRLTNGSLGINDYCDNEFAEELKLILETFKFNQKFEEKLESNDSRGDA